MLVGIIDGRSRVGRVSAAMVARFAMMTRKRYARRQDVGLDHLGRSGSLEVRHEIRSAIDLDTFECEGQIGFQLVEEQHRRVDPLTRSRRRPTAPAVTKTWH